MNKTRIQWSQDLKCCSDRSTSLFEFFCLAFGSIFLAIVFYVGMFTHSIRSERAELSIPNDLIATSRSIDAVMNINPEQPSTSSRHLNGIDDQDDDILTILPVSNEHSNNLKE